ncbi:MAG: type II toxin-antitoxin system VapB family antitoxin [Prochlorococcaceae cyanobacterium]
MGMTIKDPQVHAMAKELATRRGTSVTNAVRQALRAELDRCPGTSGQEEAARRDALLQLLSRCRQLPWPDDRGSGELQADLHDDAGLPV